MNKISELLTDPSWWFSTFFIAMLVGVASAYIKDWINMVISYFFVGYRKWYSTRISKDLDYINSLANDSDILILSYIRLIIMFLSIIFLEIIALSFTVNISVPKAIFSSIVEGIALIFLLRFSNRFRLVSKAYQQYKERNNLIF